MTTSAEPPTQDGAGPLLLVEHADAAYGSTVAFEDVNLKVQPGGAVALVGPNGAGKSTLLKALVGMVPFRGGNVSVLGHAPASVRGDVAYVPQVDTLDAEFPVTALQVALMGRYRRIGWGRRPRAADRHSAATALAEVGLAEVAGARFGTLSGGQRQRVLLARAIAQEARLLLLDEPFNGLDATTSDVLVGVIERLRADGAGVVMSTHDLTVAQRTCSHVCLLNRLQVAFGSVGSTLTPDLLRKAYGGDVVLLAAAPESADTIT